MATLIFTVLFAVTVAFGAIVGLIRGLNKAVIRIMTLAVAALLTFLLAAPVTTVIADSILIEGQTLGQMILDGMNSTDMMANILAAAPLMQEAILVAPAFAIALVVFPVIFFVLKFITWIVFLFVQKPLRKVIFKDACTKEYAAQQSKGVRIGKRFGGMGVGIVTGVLIFGMIFTPFFGLLSALPDKSFMDDALDTVTEQIILSKEDAGMIRDTYAITGHPIITGYRLIGLNAAGRAYLNAVTKIEAGGHKTSLINEIDSLMNTLYTAMDCGLANALLSPEEPNAIFNFLADKDQVDALMNAMFESKFLRAAVPELMAMAMESMAASMNVPANKEAVYHNMMQDVALAVQNSGIDFSAIAEYEQAQNLPRNFARSKTEHTPDTGVMNQEEYEAAIRQLVDLASTISSILNKALAGDNQAFTDSVADYIVNQVKSQANDGSLEHFDATTVQNTIAGIDAGSLNAGEGNAAELLGQLSDEEQFKTDSPTVETIASAIRESVANAVADDTTATQTATTLASVISDFAGAVSSATDENGNLDASKLDFSLIASAVSTLQNSPLKDVGSSVLDVVAAGDLGSNSLVSDALNAVKEGYDNGEDISGTITTAGALIGLGSAMSGGESGEVSQDAVADSLINLINNLDEFTIGLLPTILSHDTMVSMGIPAEFATPAYNVLETLLKELMKLKGSENYENETNAILALYNLATGGVSDFTEEDIPDLINYALESDAIFNTLVSISTSNPFGIDIQDEDARASLVEGIESNYNKSGKTQRERDIYNAIATLLGLDGEVNLA